MLRQLAEFSKCAGLMTELASVISPVNHLAPVITQPIGLGAAAGTPTRTPGQQVEASKQTYSNMLIPGKGVYNYYKRLGHTAADQGTYAPVTSEMIGSLTSLLAAGGIGAGIGAGAGAVGGGDIGASAIGGGAIGLGVGTLAQLLGMGAAASTKGWNKKDMREHAKDSTLLNYLVPGYANYNHLKRLGYSQREYDEAADEEEYREQHASHLRKIKV